MVWHSPLTSSQISRIIWYFNLVCLDLAESRISLAAAVAASLSSTQFDRSRIHLSEFWFNPVSAAYIIHFVDQLEPPATSAAAPVERHVFIVRRTVSQVFVFLVVVFIYISLFHRDFS